MAKFEITEELLAQIENLQMLLKNNVAGMFGGNHKSRTYGSSCEFADYRDYVDGDDTTKLDWNAYARFDKLYLKLFLDERQMHTRIYIDASRSMEYGDPGKAERALLYAATLAYLSVCEMDKVSIYVIKDKAVHEIIRGMVGKESFLSSINKLEEITFDGDSFISEAIVPENVGYGDGLSVIISDFLTDNDYEAAIDHLIGKRRDVFCLQILSLSEITPQHRGKVHFFDSENPALFYRKDIDREIAKAYKRALEYATSRIRDYCNARGADYLLVSAEDKPQDVLFEKLVNMGVFQ
ncbi:MAG: DUF58 domain-containing protein [Clostridia bacterium]|nr:DUF58 domain-containing protein [Clostridia bacterium]